MHIAETIMKHLARGLVAMAVAGMIGCARVPKESIELSSTVGRDVSAIQASHITLIDLYFDDKESLINQWIDHTYAPSQITAVVSIPAIRAELETAIREAAGGQNQDRLIRRFDSVLTLIRNDVEKTRKELLMPVQSARNDTLAKIQAAYSQVQLGNNIVTGYLSSVAKITDTQNELLARAGLGDVRDKLPAGIVRLSDNLDRVLMTTSDKCQAVAGVLQAVSEYTGKPFPASASCN
jgi:hypothetical protein